MVLKLSRHEEEEGSLSCIKIFYCRLEKSLEDHPIEDLKFQEIYFFFSSVIAFEELGPPSILTFPVLLFSIASHSASSSRLESLQPPLMHGRPRFIARAYTLFMFQPFKYP